MHKQGVILTESTYPFSFEQTENTTCFNYLYNIYRKGRKCNFTSSRDELTLKNIKFRILPSLKGKVVQIWCFDHHKSMIDSIPEEYPRKGFCYYCTNFCIFETDDCMFTA